MTARANPPFRADHVGSLLRPPRLRDARAKAAAGEISSDQLRAVEDDAIRDVVALQENAGLQVVTDGEFRRTYWHFDFLSGFDGFELGKPLDMGTFEGVSEQPPSAMITAELRRSKPVMVDHYTYLAGLTERTAKISVPGPSMAHFRAGRAGISAKVYPDLAVLGGFDGGLPRRVGRHGGQRLHLYPARRYQLCLSVRYRRARQSGEQG